MPTLISNKKTNAPKGASKTAAKETAVDSPFVTVAELGEIVPDNKGKSAIHVRIVDIKSRDEKEKPRRVLDIRQYLTGAKYTGYGKGVSIPLDQADELCEMISADKISAATTSKSAAKKALKKGK